MSQARAYWARIGVWPWHPFFAAALPVLEFYRTNYGSSYVRDVIWLVGAYVLGTAVLLAILRCALGTTRRAALAVTPLTFVLLRGGGLAPSVVIATGVATLLGALALRAVRNASLRQPTILANLILAILVVMPVARTIRAQRLVRTPRARASVDTVIQLGKPATTSAPDIYFIVADGLGEPRILEQRYGLQQATLRQPFEALGFRFVEGSRSNYPQTALSLASTLNLDYVQKLLEITDVSVHDRRPLGRLIADNRLVRTLRGAGYRIVSIPSGYELAGLNDADARLRPTWGLRFLALHNLRNTVLPHIQRALGRGPADFEFALHRHRLRTSLRYLPRARQTFPSDEPLFVFAHLIAPHPPFVFGAQGEALRSNQRFAFRDGNHWLLERPENAPGYTELYAAQTRYVVSLLARTVEAVLAKAPRPTVIIIQGDHGPGGTLVWDIPSETDTFERHGIFNAWHVPPGIHVALPNGLTSVNTFRVLLAACFDAPLPRLDDRAYFARWMSPYAFLDLGTATRPAAWIQASTRLDATELP